MSRLAMIVCAVAATTACRDEPGPAVETTLQEAILECAFCEDGPSPAAGTCQEYDCGGTSGVHYYTCCNNCEGPGPHPADSPEYDGASDGNYCGACGANIGGGCTNGDPYTCGGVAGQTACNTFCNECAITFMGACWNWSLCFEYCCADGNPSDGVDGWICIDWTSPSTGSTSAADVALVEQTQQICHTRVDSVILGSHR